MRLFLNAAFSYLNARKAIDNGYRHFDTAFHYQNEDAVGRAINDAIKEKNLKSGLELFQA